MAAGAWLAGACGGSAAPRAAGSDTLDITAFDTATVWHLEDTARVRSVPPPPTPRLSALADSLRDQMTFFATFQHAFVAAARGRRLLVDIGRVDAKLTTPARRRAYQEAVALLAPVRVGDRFRLHGPWGGDDATVAGYDQWNGRIVATLDVPPNVRALARRSAARPLVALAVRADSAAPPVADSCQRDSVGGALAARVALVRDSLTRALLADTLHVPARLLAARRVHATQAIGCFGPARVMLFAHAATGDYAFVRERAALVDTLGRATPLRVRDLRFKAHQALGAFDADGDGVDDIAVMGRAERSGGTVVLHLDPVKRQLEYIMSGFAWEAF